MSDIQLRLEREAWERAIRRLEAELTAAESREKGLRAALVRIAAMKGEPVKPDGSTCIDIARAVLATHPDDVPIGREAEWARARAALAEIRLADQGRTT